MLSLGYDSCWKSHYGFYLANDLFTTLKVLSIGLRSLCVHDHFIDKYLCERWQSDLSVVYGVCPQNGKHSYELKILY